MQSPFVFIHESFHKVKREDGDYFNFLYKYYLNAETDSHGEEIVSLGDVPYLNDYGV